MNKRFINGSEFYGDKEQWLPTWFYVVMGFSVGYAFAFWVFIKILS